MPQAHHFVCSFAFEGENGQKSMEQLVNIKYIFFYPQNYEFLFVQKVMALETSFFFTNGADRSAFSVSRLLKDF